MIVLEKVNQLRRVNEGILDDLTMEILRVLSSPDLDVRRKALSIAMDMVSSKNVEEVVLLLKKELSKTVDEQYEKVGKPEPLSRDDTDKACRTTNIALCSSTQSTNVLSSSPRSLPASLAY